MATHEMKGFPFETLWNNSPDILSIMDASGRLIANSPASERIHGYGADRLVGKETSDYIHPDDRPGIQSAMSDAFADPGRVVLIRYRYRNADSSWIWMEATGVAQPDQEGRLLLYVCSRDARRQVETEGLLDRTAKEKEALVHEIQHRVKNSIAMISSFVALEEGRAEVESVKRVLENLRFRVDAISALYRIVFATGNPQAVNLRAYLERLIFDIGQTIDRPDVSTRLELDEAVIDPKRAVPFGILCTELVVNALRPGFSEEEEGLLTIRLRVGEERLRLVVENDGRPLPQDFSIATHEGLGLQIARMLAGQLKGSLAADSMEGKGARFTLDIPWEQSS